MKKLLTSLLALLTCFACATAVACGESGNNSNGGNSNTGSNSETGSNSDTGSEEDELQDAVDYLETLYKEQNVETRQDYEVLPAIMGYPITWTVDVETGVTLLNVTYTPTPTDGKDVRLHAIAPKVECGRVYLVDGEWNEEFIDEVCGFPSKAHDEYVDLLGYAVNYFMDDDITIPPDVSAIFAR